MAPFVKTLYAVWLTVELNSYEIAARDFPSKKGLQATKGRELKLPQRNKRTRHMGVSTPLPPSHVGVWVGDTVIEPNKYHSFPFDLWRLCVYLHFRVYLSKVLLCLSFTFVFNLWKCFINWIHCFGFHTLFNVFSFIFILCFIMKE